MTNFDFGFGEVPAHRHPNGGGWVADTANVDATCYVGPYACVYGDAYVTGNAQVYGNAHVYGDARVTGNACVSGDACVYGDARVTGNAHVYGNARVYGDAWVSGNAHVYGNAYVSRTPLVLTGFPHTVTVTDNHIRVGCQMHKPSVWAERGAAIIKADGHTASQSKEWSAIINSLSKAHGCVDP